MLPLLLVMYVIDCRPHMAVVEKLSRSGHQETQVAPYFSQSVDPAGSASLCSLLPFPYFGEHLVFARRQDPTLSGFKLGTLLSTRQDSVPLSRPASPSKETVEVVSLGSVSLSHVSFCSLTVLLRPCLAHTVWPNFMEVSALLTASYVLDLLLQNSP